MFSKEEKSQYNRHFILDAIGMKGQEKLKKSKVLVVGAGGVVELSHRSQGDTMRANLTETDLVRMPVKPCCKMQRLLYRRPKFGHLF